MSFPHTFIWGAASAAYQIEGAIHEDGKGLSDWDVFCERPHSIWNRQSGAVACDHYHRYQEDVALMHAMGLKGYRFSISWTRILPQGTGTVNPKGLAFYNRLVDTLLAHNIIPIVTLFHWDYPYALFQRDGWLNPDSSDWFAEYAQTVVSALSDRVRYWLTLNEPQCVIQLGHINGTNAPGLKLSWHEAMPAAHHLLLAHGKAVQAIRAHAKFPCKVGYAPSGHTLIPASVSPEDIESARTGMFAVTTNDVWMNALWQDPVYQGRYPDELLKQFDQAHLSVTDHEMRLISQPLDFCGVNIYDGQRVGRNPDGSLSLPGDHTLTGFPQGHALTAYKWPLAPEALYWGPRFFWERYHLPVLITENGMSNPDWIALDGKVHDPQRIDFMHRYLWELKRVNEEGIPILGYMHWSILDNFEWAEGYKERFGLVYVDYPTQKRILKDSASWYREVIASNGDML